MANFSFTATDVSRRNIAVWDACAYADSLRKQVTTDLKILATGSQRNGGIVVNYHWVDVVTNPHIEYFHVLLNQQRQKLQLLRFTGFTAVVIHEVSPSRLINTDDWYRMQVGVTQHPTNTAISVIRASVDGVSDDTWPRITFTVPTSLLLPADGLYGLGTDRSRTRFSYYRIEELP